MKIKAIERLSIRTTTEEKEIIEEIAKEQGRTMSNFILYVLREYIANYKKAKEILKK